MGCWYCSCTLWWKETAITSARLPWSYRTSHRRVPAIWTLRTQGHFMKFRDIVCLVGFIICFRCGAWAQEKTGSWGTLGGGYIYQLTEGNTGHWTSTHGWYVLPTFNINKQVGVFADFANLYGKGQNLHIELYGALHAFGNRTRYTPFVFTGPGWVRDSNAGTVSTSFLWCGGGGLLIRLNRFVSFQTIPLEYVVNTANGNVGNNFDARAGLAFTLPKK